MEENRTTAGRTKTTKKRASDFIVQGTILAAAGIIVRLIGMLYRIPLANILGDEGNGYYSSAFSIYSILLIVSSYSLPTAVSKMVATKMARKEYRNSVRILKAALFYGTAAGGIGAAILWFGADLFATKVLNMPYTRYALKTLAPTIWVIAYLGVFRGYFQGLGTMIPTALSQILEQIINAVISILAAHKLFEEGIKSNLVHGANEYSFAFGAAGGTIGTGAGAVSALCFLLFILLAYRPVMRRRARRDRTSRRETYKEISGVLFMTVFPIVLSSVAYNISTVLDNSIYGNGMETFGMTSKQIATSWGVYSGKYHLLFNIPVAIANSLAASLIPSLSRAVEERNKRQIVKKVSMVIRFSMLIAIPATVGLTVLAGPICRLLFSHHDNTALIQMMKYGALAVVFFSLSTVTNAVLQGINHMQTPIKNAVIALALHVAALYIMMFLFKMGIYGVVYSNILFALFMCVLNSMAIRRYLRYRQEWLKTFLLPALASCVMGAAALGMYKAAVHMLGSNLISTFLRLVTKNGQALSANTRNLIGTLFAIVIAVVVYCVLLLKLRCVSEAELAGMPGGTKLVRIAKKFHLM